MALEADAGFGNLPLRRKELRSKFLQGSAFVGGWITLLIDEQEEDVRLPRATRLRPFLHGCGGRFMRG